MSIKRKLLCSITSLALIATSLIMAIPFVSASDNPWVFDAEIYAKQQGVTIEEALYRFEIQRIAGPLDGELRDKEAETFAGLWLEHSPEFKLVVLFTRDAEETIKNYLPKELDSITEVSEASLSIFDLKKIQAELHIVFQELGIKVTSGIDVKENKVEINISESYQFDSAISNGLLDIPECVEVNIVEQLPQLAADIYGGVHLNKSTWLWPSHCTAGFPVIHPSGAKGITTAGHADNSLRYGGLFGTDLTYQAGWYQGSYDVQWHTCPGLTVLPKIRYAADGSTRTIYNTVGRDSQGVGWYVSKYGMTTGYTAGYIADKDVWLSCVPSSNATFIRVDNTAGYPVLADYGDSGGPWFFGSDAYGTTVAKNDSGDAYYMAVNYIYEAIGVNVYTG